MVSTHGLLLVLLPASTALPANPPAPAYLMCSERYVAWVHDNIIVRVAHALPKQLGGGVACRAGQRGGQRDS
jgi:hypothetical protein